MESTSDKKPFLSVPVSILFAAVIIAGGIVVSGQLKGGGAAIGDAVPTDDTPTLVENWESYATSDDPVIGSADAPVTIIEFSDFECPFCGSFWADTYGQLKKDYVDTGKVRFIYRDFPLSFHPQAKPAALAAACAHEQGKFWPYHDKIFGNQKALGDASYTAWATELGLNAAQFSDCYSSGKYSDEVDEDMAAGSVAGVSGTPSFIINGQLIVGAQPLAAFKAAIETALQ
jgi:protein-disulfide isomerase